MESRERRAAVEPKPRGLSRVAALLRTVTPRLAATVAGVGITVLTALGILQRTLYPEWAMANLDSEAAIATWFAATLLWTAAAYWLVVALMELPRQFSTLAWSGLLMLLALDESNAIHERFERWLETDWQILYLPIMALSGLMWWRVVARYRRSRIATLLVAGAGAWGVTLVLELVQNWGGPPVRASIYNPTMITEEALEMVGSTLIWLAGLMALRAQAALSPSDG